MEDYLFGIGEPYFGQSHLTSDHMSSYEEQAFSLCKYEFISTVNPNQLVREMRRRLTLPRQAGKTFLHLEKKGLDRERICYLLFQILPLFSNLQNLVICLERCKYNNLTTTLFWNLFKVRTKVLVVIQRVSPEQRQGLQEFSRKLKRSVHNAPFGNRSIFLRRLAKIYVKRIEKEHDPYKRQTFADKYITIIAAEIDVHAIEFNTNLHNSSMFSHMKYVISETSNTLVTDIGYFGRLANAYAIAGKYSDSEDMLKEARCRSLNIGPGLELFNLLYTEVYVRLWQFETFPTPDLRDALLFWGRLGLKSLEEDDIYSLTIWKRNLIMRMVFCLLGLGNRGNVIEKCVVSDNCIQEACRLLGDFQRYLDGIETRRLMLYGLAKARLFEIKDKDYAKCFECLIEAKHYAETGRFKELHFINEYYTRIFKMVQQPNTPYCHSFKLQHELPNDNYAMLQPPFTTQYLDLCGRTPEENNDAMMRSPCSTPSFHFYIPMSKEISNCHMIRSACSTPSFHSFWPLQDKSRNYVTAESSSSTPYFHPSLPQSEGNGNPLILQPVSLAPSFHSLRLQDETMGNYVMSQSLCTTPSFHSLRPHDETMGNWLMLHSLCTTPSFHSCMPQNETSGNYVLLQSSFSTFSFHSFWPQNGIMPFNDYKNPNNDFNCGYLNSLLGERNSDMFCVERGEPSGCSQPETNILPSHTGGFNCYTDISTSVKSCVPGVQLEGNNTNMKFCIIFKDKITVHRVEKMVNLVTLLTEYLK